MNILHIIGSFDKKNGGTYSAISSIIKIENQLGFNNEVLSISHLNQEYDNELFKGKINLFKHSFPNKFNNSRPATDWLELNIKYFNLLVLHEVWSILAVQAARTAIKTGINYIIWPHGSLDPFDLNKKKIFKIILGRIILKKILKKATAICCTSELEKSLLECYEQNSVNKKVLPLPIDFDEKGDRFKLRKAFSIHPDTFLFLFFSRVDYKKGLDIFLYALASFIKQGPYDIKLLIAGNGTKEYESYIDVLIKNLNLRDYVVKAGFLSGSQKADAFAGSDCFVLTSKNENYGISVIESLQSNLQVLISENVYIWREIIPEAGWVCRYDEDSILSSIRQIYKQFLIRNQQIKFPAKTGNKFRMQNLLPEYRSFYLNL